MSIITNQHVKAIKKFIHCTYMIKCVLLKTRKTNNTNFQKGDDFHPGETKQKTTKTFVQRTIERLSTSIFSISFFWVTQSYYWHPIICLYGSIMYQCKEMINLP